MAIVVLAASAALVLAVMALPLLRPRPRLGDALLVIAGAGLGLGALLPQHGVEAAEWIVAPVVIAALLPVHVRLLFAGEGFLRV